MTFIRQLFRKTATGSFIAEVDGLRFFAILFVLTSHSWGNWLSRAGNDYSTLEFSGLNGVVADLLLQGKHGVFLFFAISGFILALPWLKHALADGKAVEIRQFYLRRLTRLEPLYILLMTFYFIALSAAGRLDFYEDFFHYLASIFYVHNIVYGQGSTIYSAAWSLEVEFQFYMIAPLIFTYLFKLNASLRRLILILAIIIGTVLADSFPKAPPNLFLYIHFFSAGILLADLYVSYPAFFNRRVLVYDSLAILGFILMFLIFDRLSTQMHAQLGYTVACMLLFFAAFNGYYFKAFVGWAPIYIIGGMCYSIYLVHARVMTGVYQYAMNGMVLTGDYIVDHMILNLTVVPLSILLSAIVFVLIERPTMDSRWPQKLKAWFQQRTGKSSP